ncbi:hypothetical protein [Deinococcus wulumuqiensis]|uniref:DUF4034 domain-containing protein n=1 Tax=Deinococcus wulumuqiensis TaxID=980427 RepID=A0AAV4K7Y2_9DEIO|nr:hypothetical protein [Deinococcus wulumuqiensis]GGI85486.1 hypothetical protein GCM10010914_19870 [Deinococcus wulumuqiensis]GGP30074.1 hypothetical protein GCM10008021_17250 [Deinococcus wulumuqiensis]
MTLYRTGPTDPLSDLRGGRLAELQRTFGVLQAEFERGRAAGSELTAAFLAFARPDPVLGEALSEWERRFPVSYAARVARAQWLLSRAAALRGEQPASRLSDLDGRGTLHLLGEAEAVARQALRLSVNPLSAWLLVGQARNLAGGQLSLDDVRSGRYPDWYVRPLAQNPRSLALRQVMLAHLRPEWGGSDEQMFTFVRQQEQEAQLGAGDRHRLWADYHAAAGHHAAQFAGDLVGGVERARLAADLHEPHSAGLFAALTRALAPDHERQRALERFLDVAEFNPALRLPPLFAWALYNSDRFLEPLLPRVTALLLRWANGTPQGGAGDAGAAVALGRLHLLARHWALPDPLPLLLRARDEGSREAAETIVQLQEEGLGLRAALRESNIKRTDVRHAAELGSPEMCWRIYQNFAPYREQFRLEHWQRERYLLRAADAGHNGARFELAQALRAGALGLGEDGVPYPMNMPPTQRSLDYARHLLERAAAEDHPGALNALRAAHESDWHADTARRLRRGA